MDVSRNKNQRESLVGLANSTDRLLSQELHITKMSLSSAPPASCIARKCEGALQSGWRGFTPCQRKGGRSP